MNLLWTGLIMGLASSAHCLLMCGPLVMGMSSGGGPRAFTKPLLYHGGRMGAYAGIGLLFGLLSEVVSLIPYQQAISLFTGILLLAGAAVSFVPSVGKAGLRAWQKLSPVAFKSVRKLPRNLSVISLGILNGLLPCGMVYLAATASLHGGTVEYSMAYMLLFGAGTLPAMAGISFAGKFIRAKRRIAGALPYMAMVMAFLFILRGLSLDIPYLSPDISFGSGGEVKACCVKR